MKKFLLHTCCAPCSIAIIDELKSKYELTVFFYNPNIYPESEYLKRKAEVVKVCEEWNVKMIDFEKTHPNPSPYEPKAHPSFGGKMEGACIVDYDQEKWNEAVKGLENEPEMGARCPVCFRLRLEKTAQYASANGFNIFSTSLTSGRNKKAEIINSIGLELAKKYNIEYLVEDWKKAGRPTSAKATAGKQESRQEKATRLINERGIYRQDYCGCKFSIKN